MEAESQHRNKIKNIDPNANISIGTHREYESGYRISLVYTIFYHIHGAEDRAAGVG